MQLLLQDHFTRIFIPYSLFYTICVNTSFFNQVFCYKQLESVTTYYCCYVSIQTRAKMYMCLKQFIYSQQIFFPYFSFRCSFFHRSLRFLRVSSQLRICCGLIVKILLLALRLLVRSELRPELVSDFSSGQWQYGISK